MLQRLKHELFHRHNKQYGSVEDLFFVEEDKNGTFTVVFDHDFLEWLIDESEIDFNVNLGDFLAELSIVIKDYWKDLQDDNWS